MSVHFKYKTFFMPFSKIFSCFILTFILGTTAVLSRQSTHPVTIEVKYNDDGEPTFYAKNTTVIPYTVTIDFTSVRNSMPPNPNPYTKTARPGRRKLLELKKSGLSDSGVRFNYSYSYNIGCMDTDPDDLEYLLPIAEGKTTEVFGLSYIGEMFDKEPPEDFYALGFNAEPGDTVFASRSGFVARVVNEYQDKETENFFTSNYNYVQLVHEDCTFASYSHLKKDGIFVNKGDKITAGEPIGIVASTEESERVGFRMSLIYRNDDYRKGTDDPYWNYAVPKFRTSVEKKAKLKKDHVYRAVHPVDVITQEMGWFERRRWKKRN